MTTQDFTQADVVNLAERLFSGNTEAAFRYWALSCLLADQDVSEDILLEHVDLDGSGDLGIDGYWVDDSNSRLLLMQSKYTARSASRVGRQAVQEFRAAAMNLLDQTYIRRHGNRRMREAYADIQEALLDDGFSLWIVLTTNRRVSRPAHDYVMGEGAAPWLFQYDSHDHRKDVAMDVLTIQELELFRDQLLAASIPAPEVSLSIPHSMYHEMAGEYRGAQALVVAKDVADAYRIHRAAIFRRNVRGPLGANKVNKEIVKSLEDQIFRRNFHLLNNGLTVLCSGFTYDPQAHQLEIKDFQVVNGCQTTYTLHEYRDLLDENVWLKLTIVEGPTWATIIAKSTNTQSTVKAEDFRTLEEIHTALKMKFDLLDPPWLYEVKRGEYRFTTATQQRQAQARFGLHRLTMREVAQSTISFLGHPCLAKFDLGAVFDPQNEEGAELYGRIFNADLSAEQLLIPTLIARRVKDKVRERVRLSSDVVVSDSPADVDWLPYARMHLIGLIAEWLRITESRQGTQSNGFLPPTTARARIATIGDWFDQAFDAAVEAIRYRIDVFTDASGPLTNLREYFRSNENYKKMVERLRYRLD